MEIKCIKIKTFLIFYSIEMARLDLKKNCKLLSYFEVFIHIYCNFSIYFNMLRWITISHFYLVGTRCNYVLNKTKLNRGKSFFAVESIFSKSLFFTLYFLLTTYFYNIIYLFSFCFISSLTCFLLPLSELTLFIKCIINFLCLI